MGTLVSSRTGTCSNVFTDGMYEEYFTDNFNFLNDNLLNSKLFTNTSIGPIMNNIEKGFSFRRNKLSYHGSAATLLNCMRSDGSSAWTSSDVTRSEIEFRTTLYFSNIRPMSIHRSTKAVSYVQSHVVLIWRLYRNALVNSVFASTLDPLMLPAPPQQPEVYLNSAIVSTPVDRTHAPIVDQMEVDIEFSTVPPSRKYVMVYEENSIEYKPQSNDAHTLLHVVDEPLYHHEAPMCLGNHEDKKCMQTWNSKIILQLNDMQNIQSGKQRTYNGDLVATFSVHECADVEDVTTCNINSSYRISVTISLVLQSVLTLVDESRDEVSLHVVAIHSERQPIPFNPYGVTGHLEKAGVSDGDSITLEVQFSPTWLRSLYRLQLMLLVTCIWPVKPKMGCVAARPYHRKVHFIDPDYHSYFGGKYDSYRLHHEAGKGATINHLYDEQANLHISKFDHVALTDYDVLYTVTAIYRLVERQPIKAPYGSHHRRKRNPNGQIKTFNSNFKKAQITSISFFAEGCVNGLVFDNKTRICISSSDGNGEYTTSTNQHERISSFPPNLDVDNSAATASASFVTIFIAVYLNILF
ncbi:uncharacterized protein LOC117105730 isoform X2 [Anneissia japonica]|nr:uncharacterized protein LOC117105730 isoform X2 [Anneissia japonica]